MEYDPIKKTLGNAFNRFPFTRILFYKLLDLLLLRTWHIHRELQSWHRGRSGEASILDAGSGFGQYSYYMSRLSKSYSILGVDVKEDQVAECNALFRSIGRKDVVFQVEDVTKFVMPDRFDLVLCVDVMEHILEDEQVLRNYCSNLKKNGLLLISTPSDQGGSDVHGEGESSFIGEHVRDGYSRVDMEEKLKRAGFSRSAIQYSYGKPGQVSWRLSMKYPMKMLHVSQLFFILLPVYYVVVMPICLALNAVDSRIIHASGTGLIVRAWK